MKTNRREKATRAYQFLTIQARNQTVFALQDLQDASGWSRNTIQTYMAKQWGHFLVKCPAGYRVSREFLRLSEPEFLGHISQKREYYGTYRRQCHEMAVTFEFLVPPHREDSLRRALDDLFHRDVVEQRIGEIGLASMEKVIPRDEGVTDREYVNELLDFCSLRFTGYSVSHMSGRSRSGHMITRPQAAELMTSEGKYLVTETTAIIRFVVPCLTGMTSFGDSATNLVDMVMEDHSMDDAALRVEASQIRCLFFLFFVEAVIRTFRGEDEIQLVERGERTRLYAWTKQP